MNARSFVFQNISLRAIDSTFSRTLAVIRSPTTPPVAFALIHLPPVLICLVSMVYSVLSVRAFNKSRP
ncbi:hypothetical protein BD779DRAFT_1674472 [Infundibulicybe gibba]|nr:hypothetical protein BD779DRAFT_1674472 [Infundibulicybe gibba]